MSPSYSKSKVSAFFGSHTDPQLRESIRQDVLVERHDDLLEEMSHLENLLNISETDFNKDLFVVNEILFEMLESLVPELIEEEEEEPSDNCEDVHPNMPHDEWLESNQPGVVDDGGPRIHEADNPGETERQKRVEKIKSRETAAISIAKDKENLVRAKSLIRSAGLDSKSAKTPEAKRRAMKTIAKAKKTLTGVGKKK